MKVYDIETRLNLCLLNFVCLSFRFVFISDYTNNITAGILTSSSASCYILYYLARSVNDNYQCQSNLIITVHSSRDLVYNCGGLYRVSVLLKAWIQLLHLLIPMTEKCCENMKFRDGNSMNCVDLLSAMLLTIYALNLQTTQPLSH